MEGVKDGTLTSLFFLTEMLGSTVAMDTIQRQLLSSSNAMPEMDTDKIISNCTHIDDFPSMSLEIYATLIQESK